MYNKGLLTELSKKLIRKVAKRTVGRYQKEADVATHDVVHGKASKQDEPSREQAERKADVLSDKARAKRAQARRVLAKMSGREKMKDQWGDRVKQKDQSTYSGERSYKVFEPKHGLSRKDLKGKAEPQKPGSEY